MKSTTKRCPYCSKAVDPTTATKIVSDLGDGTGRRGRPGYRDQRPVTKFWHPECVTAFEEQATASRERFLEESRQQMAQALRDLGNSEEFIAEAIEKALS
jgi:hypothetical protein